MKEITKSNNLTLGGSVKKSLFIVALAAILVFAFAGAAFAVDHSGNLREGAPVVAPAVVGGGIPTVTVAGAGTYTYFDWSVGYDAQANDNSPHGNYATTTVKCVVCHAVHYAAPGGAPVGSGQAADTLLRMKASDACGFCHASTGTSVNGRPVYDGLYVAGMPSGGSQNTGHATSTACTECHTGPHGAGADESVASLAGYLLKNQANNGATANTMMAAITAIDTTAVAQGFASGAALGATPATYGSTNSSVLREQAVGIFCAECHAGAYATVAAGAKTNVLNGSTASFTGHRIAAGVNPTWNTGNSISSGAITATQIAWAAADNCKSCHDAKDTFGNVAFPHSWGGAKMWLTESDNAGDAKTPAGPYGAAAGSGFNKGANSAPGVDGSAQLHDGVCLKCHVAGGNVAGVGINF